MYNNNEEYNNNRANVSQIAGVSAQLKINTKLDVVQVM